MNLIWILGKFQRTTINQGDDGKFNNKYFIYPSENAKMCQF